MSREEWLAEMAKDRTNVEDERGFLDARYGREAPLAANRGFDTMRTTYNQALPDRTSYEAAKYHAEKAPDDPRAQKLFSDAAFAKMVNELKKKRVLMVTR